MLFRDRALDHERGGDFPDRALFAIVIFGGLLYGLYVFHLGFSMLLRVPHEATGMGTAVVITLTLAAFVALGWGLAYLFDALQLRRMSVSADTA
jgi:hypothetical protein